MDIVEGEPDYGTLLAYLLEHHASAFIHLHNSWILSNIFETYITTIVSRFYVMQFKIFLKYVLFLKCIYC